MCPCCGATPPGCGRRPAGFRPSTWTRPCATPSSGGARIGPFDLLLPRAAPNTMGAKVIMQTVKTTRLPALAAAVATLAASAALFAPTAAIAADDAATAALKIRPQLAERLAASSATEPVIVVLRAGSGAADVADVASHAG